MKDFLRIGITGGIAAGKSMVSAHLVQNGYAVIDYDILAREVVKPGSALLDDIQKIFGRNVLIEEGSLNREWLAAHVFTDVHKLSRLNAVIHPAVYQLAKHKEDDLRSQGHAVVFHDVPLLVETLGIAQEHGITYDHILTVEAPDDVRIERMLTTRHMAVEDARARIAAQLTPLERKAYADAVIDSSQPLDVMLDTVDNTVRAWLTA